MISRKQKERERKNDIEKIKCYTFSHKNLINDRFIWFPFYSKVKKN